MPSQLFNILFLAALIVPVAMYLVGLLFLFGSLIARQRIAYRRDARVVEALAH